jgi:hypothetical protein
MVLIASIFAYLCTVTGISVGLLMLVCMFFTTPRPPTLLAQSQTTAARQTEPTPRMTALSKLLKTGSHRQSTSASRADSRVGSQPSGAGHTRYAMDRAPALLGQKSHRLVSRDHGKEWAYRHEPTGFSRRASYAQELSAYSSHIW